RPRLGAGRTRPRGGLLVAPVRRRARAGLYPRRPMRVAILGTRGIPAAYSGFETAAEQLARRLSERGHEVVVYCRPHVVDRRLKHWRGARLVHLPTVRNKYLDTL